MRLNLNCLQKKSFWGQHSLYAIAPNLNQYQRSSIAVYYLWCVSFILSENECLGTWFAYRFDVGQSNLIYKCESVQFRQFKETNHNKIVTQILT